MRISAKKLVISLFCMAMIVICAQKVSAFAGEPLTGKSAAEITDMMGMGWNLGNTFDATGGNVSDIYSFETSWGNPKVTHELIDAIAASGLKTIRVPVTWNKNVSTDGSYTIRPEYLARVKEVVDYCFDNDLFVILNCHHESWINRKDLDKSYMQTAEELGAVWSQIAAYFADYDQHLIFEGMNEPRMQGSSVEWTGNAEAYAAINYLDQVFANAVRADGTGYNAERCLMIPQYAASSSASIMAALSLPVYNGEVVNNLIASVHGYAPYDFCLSDKMVDFDIDNPACVGAIDTLFNSIQSVFLDNGIPVVLGETGATNKDNTEARENWAGYIGAKAGLYGVPTVIWDNGAYGNKGGECHAWINRTSCEWNYPTVLQAFLDASTSVEWGSYKNSDAPSDEPIEAIVEGGSPFWSVPEGHESTKEWEYTYIQIGAQTQWFVPGRDIVIAYKGAGEPKVILDSEAKGVWWIPVDPDSVEEVNGYKYARFSYDSMYAEMTKNGVDNVGDLRYFSVITTNGMITTYEISCVGGDAMVTYKANGKIVAMGTELPEKPLVEGMNFLGWYSSIDYKPGTEFNGEPAKKDMLVYAKYELGEEAEDDVYASAAEDSAEVTEPAEDDENTAEVTDTDTEPAEDKEPELSPEPTEEAKPEITPSEEAADKPAPTEAAVENKDTVSTNDKSASGMSTGVIVAIIAGVIAVVLAAILVIKKKK
ncbi:MAG: cellulase family glycosylhydrolase [Lachnospiraceae bacterium]|nr:cellulase family glycosylhydrolase [Lachnospiraceae bacterium]